MQTVYKYPLRGTPHELATGARVDLPAGARIVHVAAQHREPTLWAEINTAETEISTRYFCLVGTGAEIPGDRHDHDYVGTVHIDPFVFHVYELH